MTITVRIIFLIVILISNWPMPLLAKNQGSRERVYEVEEDSRYSRKTTSAGGFKIRIFKFNSRYIDTVDTKISTNKIISSSIRHIAAIPTVDSNVVTQIDLFGNDVLAYPNPARGDVRFVWEEMNPESVEVLIYNSLGEKVAHIQRDQPGQYIDWMTGDIAQGIYFYRVILSVAGERKLLSAKKVAILR